MVRQERERAYGDDRRFAWKAVVSRRKRLKLHLEHHMAERNVVCEPFDLRAAWRSFSHSSLRPRPWRIWHLGLGLGLGLWFVVPNQLCFHSCCYFAASPSLSLSNHLYTFSLYFLGKIGFRLDLWGGQFI